MSGTFPVTFPGQAQYAKGFSPAPDSLFQSTTWRALSAAGSHVYGGKFQPGSLVSQHRYPKPQDDREEGEPVPFETRLGLVVAVHGTGMGDQVDVMWSDWAPAQEPVGMAASRRIRAAASARSAT